MMKEFTHVYVMQRWSDTGIYKPVLPAPCSWWRQPMWTGSWGRVMGSLGSWIPETDQWGVLCKHRRVRRKPHLVLTKPTVLHPGEDVGAYLKKASETREKSSEHFSLGKVKWSPLPVRVAIPKCKSGSCVRAHFGVFLVAATGGVLLNPMDRGSGKLLDSSEHTA